MSHHYILRLVHVYGTHVVIPQLCTLENSFTTTFMGVGLYFVIA